MGVSLRSIARKQRVASLSGKGYAVERHVRSKREAKSQTESLRFSPSTWIRVVFALLYRVCTKGTEKMEGASDEQRENSSQHFTLPAVPIVFKTGIDVAKGNE